MLGWYRSRAALFSALVDQEIDEIIKRHEYMTV